MRTPAPPRRLRGSLPALRAALPVLWLLVGCQAPARDMQAAAPRPAGTLRAERRILGASVQGRPIECLIFGRGPDCVLLIATIHGDEDAGTPLLRQLADHLAARPELIDGRRIVLIPVANPDGMAHQTRGNARRFDLNRNYPAANFIDDPRHGPAPLSEPESAAIHGLLHEVRPDRIVSIHQMLRSGTPCIDHDGPAEDLARAMAGQCHLSVEKIGSRPGSLGAYAGETLGIPIITFELPAAAKRLDRSTLWSRYGKALLAAIAYPRPLLPPTPDRAK